MESGSDGHENDDRPGVSTPKKKRLSRDDMVEKQKHRLQKYRPDWEKDPKFKEDNVLDDFEVIERILRGPRIYQIRRNYFEEYDEKAFGIRFRLYKRSALELLDLIEMKLEYPSDRNHSLSPVNQLLVTLRYYATGCHQLTMGDFGSVSRHLRQTG
ncbi:putative nuclease [Operophtera brumata]|uniref:Putative nuclease n=1 Tax=Operophtera brumata TaxID=104452 RepID=A0A0L7KN33_OPEBR|nr:putative nuclease [Operophtera brumata]